MEFQEAIKFIPLDRGNFNDSVPWKSAWKKVQELSSDIFQSSSLILSDPSNSQIDFSSVFEKSLTAFLLIEKLNSNRSPLKQIIQNYSTIQQDSSNELYSDPSNLKSLQLLLDFTTKFNISKLFNNEVNETNSINNSNINNNNNNNNNNNINNSNINNDINNDSNNYDDSNYDDEFEVVNNLNSLNTRVGNNQNATKAQLNQQQQQLKIVTEDGLNAQGKRKRRPRAPAPFLDTLFCHSCGETQTSQWRRGPDGCKSLCNACGIRFANIVNKEKALSVKEKNISIHMLLNDQSNNNSTNGNTTSPSSSPTLPSISLTPQPISKSILPNINSSIESLPTNNNTTDKIVNDKVTSNNIVSTDLIKEINNSFINNPSNNSNNNNNNNNNNSNNNLPNRNAYNLYNITGYTPPPPSNKRKLSQNSLNINTNQLKSLKTLEHFFSPQTLFAIPQNNNGAPSNNIINTPLQQTQIPTNTFLMNLNN